MNIQLDGPIKFIHLGDAGPNLLTLKRQQELIKELDYTTCKAIVFLGNNKIFSAGLNLIDLANANEDEVSEIFETFMHLLTSIRSFPGPVFSIVGGHAIAAGLSIKESDFVIFQRFLSILQVSYYLRRT